jgi:hypothetical protein
MDAARFGTLVKSSDLLQRHTEGWILSSRCVARRWVLSKTAAINCNSGASTRLFPYFRIFVSYPSQL